MPVTTWLPGGLSLFLDFPLFGEEGIQMPANLSGLFCVSLPGASDYSFSVERGDICTDNTLSFAYKAGADVGEVKYGLYPGMFSFESKDVIAKEIIYCFGQQENADEWKNIGKAEYSEDILASIWPDEVTNVVYEVDIQESAKTPGRYRLIDPYGPAYPHYQNLVNDDNIPEGHNHHHYVVVDASDPEKVFIEASPLGADFGYGQVILFSEGWFSMQTGANLNDPEVLEGFGKIENGKITFLGGAINLYMPAFGMPKGNIKHKFYIQIPDTGSVDGVVADNEGETVYYNVSGMPVANPDVSGVYVKVKGGKAEKVYVK